MKLGVGLSILAVSSALVVSAQQNPPGQQGQPSGQPQQNPQSPPTPSPSFKTGVELVSLNVPVADPQMRYATDLEQTEFQVFEDGVKQEVTYFNRSNQPIALALLVDTSASMESRMQTAQEAAS